MSVSHGYSLVPVPAYPAHPLLNEQLELLDLRPYTCVPGDPDSDTKAWQWENFQQVESSQHLETERNAHAKDSHCEDKNAQLQIPGAEQDEKITDAVDDAKESGDDESSSRQNGSGCLLKTGDFQRSVALKQEPEDSEHHPLASTRRQQPGPESFHISHKDSQDSLACSIPESKRGPETTSKEDKTPEDRDKQRRAVLDDLPGKIWNRICPHLPLDSILRLRMCNRALRRMLSTGPVQPLVKEELEPDSLPSSNNTSTPKASKPESPGSIMAAPQTPCHTEHRHYAAPVFPPAPQFYHFEPNRLMHTINKVVGQSATPSSPLSFRRGAHAMELQIPLSEETLSDSTVPLSPDEEIYTDMWVAAVAPNDDGDEGTEPCPAEPQPPDFKEFGYEMGPVMQVPMIRAKL
ncbi:hypothetical protein IWX90DRAFT_411094 [Phyllosticta citrichinensis]|uniref:F-box domain-containing protein n=1 Tax=Phyllosticta citrichinensis TaxID=1130410 RepID=A0ABR1Y6Y9_9PEZI